MRTFSSVYYSQSFCTVPEALPAQSPDVEEDLFRRVLHKLEIYEDSEMMSTAGCSASSHGESDDMDSFVDDSATNFAQHAPLSMDDIREVLQDLRVRKLPDSAIAFALTAQVCWHLQKDYSTLVHLEKPRGRLIIVGDVHGHLNDAFYLLDLYGAPSDDNQYLWNGDFVDRGAWGPELLFSLFCLKLLHPTHMHLNRGNHESEICTERYGFHIQMVQAYPQCHRELYLRIHAAFNQLPICYVIGWSICVVHGGLPKNPVTLGEIAEIRRGAVPKRIYRHTDRIFQAMLWSDPGDETGESPRGMGTIFGKEVTTKFLQDNGLKCIVRSHECVKDGFASSHDGLVITVFSASNYDSSNNANVAIVYSDLSIKNGSHWNKAATPACWAEAVVIKARVELYDSSKAGDSTLTIAERKSQVLRIRLDPSPWNCSARERALSELHRIIFLARARLLDAFDAMATRAQAKRSTHSQGQVSLEEWAQCMTICLGTPSGFPWLEIFPYLCVLGSDRQVRYVPFLARFEGLFQQWLGEKWNDCFVRYLALKHRGFVDTFFERLDVGRRNRIGVREFRPFFEEFLSGVDEHVLHTFMYKFISKLDTDGSGQVSRLEFVKALGHPSTHCLAGHCLAPVYSTFCYCREHVCDRCGGQVHRSEPRRSCHGCDYDICNACSEACASEAEVSLARAGRESYRWQNSLHIALKVTQGLIVSQCNIRAVFALADEDGDGAVNREEFICVMRELLEGNNLAAESVYTLICDYFAELGRRPAAGGQYNIEDLLEAFAITDLFAQESSNVWFGTTSGWGEFRRARRHHGDCGAIEAIASPSAGTVLGGRDAQSLAKQNSTREHRGQDMDLFE